MEETHLQPRGEGPYRLYRLTKRGWGSEELVRHLARRLRLRRALFAYGGRKDRGALTVQYLTIRSRRDRSIDGDGFELRSLGFVDRPMGPNAIRANRFSIVLRDLDPACAAEVSDNVRRLERWGVPNYFDDQRFRSFTQYRCFPAAVLVQGDWEGALRLLLTTPEPGAPRRERERLEQLAQAWGRWEEAVPLARYPHERRALERLACPGSGAVQALAELPRESLSLLLASYQSHLWNQALAAAVRQHASVWLALPGLAGDYPFPAVGVEEHLHTLRKLTIPTPGPRLAAAEPAGTEAMLRILAAEGITPAMLALRPLRTAFLKSTRRDAFVVPGGITLTWLPNATDAAREATARLDFSLPPGAYATMVVRGVLLRHVGGEARPSG